MSHQLPGDTTPFTARAEELGKFSEPAPPYSEILNGLHSQLYSDELRRIRPYGLPETKSYRGGEYSSGTTSQSGPQTWNDAHIFDQQPSPINPIPPTQQFQAISLHQRTPYYAPEPPGSFQPTTLPASISSQPPTSLSTEDADATLLSKTLAFINTVPPAPSQPSQLLRPILIPQLPPARGLGTPFMRAWAPCLSSSNLTIDHFLAFIDNLNVISLPSPPLQILNLAGNVVGMVPHHIAQLVGVGLQVGAQVGTKVVSKARTDEFLKQVNARMFGPRRMRARIVKGEEIPRLLRMTEAQATLDDAWDMDLLEKVLKNVGPYTAQFTRHDLPVPEGQAGFLDKWSSKAVEREKAKMAKKAMKQREKEIEKEEKRERKYEKKSEKEARKREKNRKKQKKKGKEPRTDISDPESSSSESEDIGGLRRDGRAGKTGKVREKEEKEARKLLWIMIEHV